MSAALRPMLAGEFDAWRAHQRERYRSLGYDEIAVTMGKDLA